MFRFKCFEVHDERCAMKVGTDGVLLGAWVDVEHDSRLLDVGTGSGLIALMLAQRNEKAYVTAIDVDEGALSDAHDNIACTAYRTRISVLRCEMQRFATDDLYDHIVTNPPYFANSQQSPDAARNLARHTSSLSFADIVDASQRLLRDGGRLSVILPSEAASKFRYEAFGRLWLRRQTDVVTCEGELPRRTMMEFVKCAEPMIPRVDTLVIQTADGSYSDEYRCMTSDFYLKF